MGAKRLLYAQKLHGMAPGERLWARSAAARTCGSPPDGICGQFSSGVARATHCLSSE